MFNSIQRGFSDMRNIRLLPLEVQSGITRLDGPGLAGQSAYFSRYLCHRRRRLSHKVNNVLSSHSVDTFSSFFDCLKTQFLVTSYSMKP